MALVTVERLRDVIGDAVRAPSSDTTARAMLEKVRDGLGDQPASKTPSIAELRRHLQRQPHHPDVEAVMRAVKGILDILEQ